MLSSTSIAVLIEAAAPTGRDVDRYRQFAASLAAAGCAPAEVSVGNIETAPEAGFLIWRPARLPELVLPSLAESTRMRLVLIDSRSDVLRDLVASNDLAGGLEGLAVSRWTNDVGMSTFGLFGRVEAARRAGLITIGGPPLRGYSLLTANAPVSLPEMVCRYLRSLRQ